MLINFHCPKEVNRSADDWRNWFKYIKNCDTISWNTLGGVERKVLVEMNYVVKINWIYYIFEITSTYLAVGRHSFTTSPHLKRHFWNNVCWFNCRSTIIHNVSTFETTFCVCFNGIGKEKINPLPNFPTSTLQQLYRES